MRHILLVLAFVSTATAQPLAGIWGTEQHLGPRVRGELVIDGRRDPWHARMGGFDVATSPRQTRPACARCTGVA